MIARLACILIASLSANERSSFEDKVTPALGVAGLTVDTARFDPGLLRMFRQAEFTMPLYETATENPWQTPFLVQVMANELGAATGKPSDVVNGLARWVGSGSRRSLIGNSISKELEASKAPGALRSTLEAYKLRGLCGEVPDTSQVPEKVQSAAAVVLLTALRTRSLFNLGLKLGDGALDSQPQALRLWETIRGSLGPDDATEANHFALLSAYRFIEPKYFLAAGHDLALASQEAAALLKDVPSDLDFQFQIRTAWGKISFNGAGNHFYANEPTLLIIDTSGDDRYMMQPCGFGGGMAWASIAIDRRGADRYLSSPQLESSTVKDWDARKPANFEPGPVGAVLGFAILFDLDGNDIYKTHLPGLGSARGGVAILHDAAGNDHYEAYQDGIAFGSFGVGIVEDLSGDDYYEGFTQIQGVGQTAGAGALIDRAGDDRYLALPTPADNPSAQSAAHNTSMAQGAGNGTRRDYVDGYSLSGGLGYLLDQGGDDVYQCAVFGQGVGYWEGVGILRDEAGNDKYEGTWYVQGASAHFAIGYLEDVLGKDEYVATMNMGQGAGHDFGFGMLVDGAGDDRHNAPNLSLGAGNANGMGMFLDSEGNDFYQSSGLTLGKSGESSTQSLRSRGLALGLFADLGGTDTYAKETPWAKNGGKSTQWTSESRNPRTGQFGIFFDSK